MTFYFGERSNNCLETIDTRLAEICFIAIDSVDFAVIEGHRGKEKQNQYFEEGKSEFIWPFGKHNKTPALAVDIFPAPYDWDNREAFIRFAAFFIGIGAGLGYKVKWGGDWDRDWNLENNRFNDWPHFEIIN